MAQPRKMPFLSLLFLSTFVFSVALAAAADPAEALGVMARTDGVVAPISVLVQDPPSTALYGSCNDQAFTTINAEFQSVAVGSVEYVRYTVPSSENACFMNSTQAVIPNVTSLLDCADQAATRQFNSIKYVGGVCTGYSAYFTQALRGCGKAGNMEVFMATQSVSTFTPTPPRIATLLVSQSGTNSVTATFCVLDPCKASANYTISSSTGTVVRATGSTITDANGLTCGHIYRIDNVKACANVTVTAQPTDSSGSTIGQSATARTTVASVAPKVNASVVKTGNENATISLSMMNDCGQATKYCLTISSDGRQIQVNSTAATEYTVTGLKKCADNAIVVFPCNDAGSAVGASVSLTAKTSGTDAVLSWSGSPVAGDDHIMVTYTAQDNCSIVDHYLVEWGGSSNTTKATSYDIRGLRGCTKYDIKVTAKDSSNNTVSNTLNTTATTTGSSANLTGVTVMANSTSRMLMVKWNTTGGTCNPVAYYVVSTSSSLGSASVNTTNTSAVVSNVTTCVAGNVTVTAYDASGKVIGSQSQPGAVGRLPTVTAVNVTFVEGNGTVTAEIRPTLDDPCHLARSYVIDVNGKALTGPTSTMVFRQVVEYCSNVTVSVRASDNSSSPTYTASVNKTAQAPSGDAMLKRGDPPVATEDSIKICWNKTDPCNKVDSFKVSYGGKNSTTKDTCYTLNVSSDCTSENFTVVGCDAAGNPVTNTLEMQAKSKPVAPQITSLTVKDGNNSKALVNVTLDDDCCMSTQVNLSIDGGKTWKSYDGDDAPFEIPVMKCENYTVMAYPYCEVDSSNGTVILKGNTTTATYSTPSPAPSLGGVLLSPGNDSITAYVGFTNPCPNNTMNVSYSVNGQVVHSGNNQFSYEFKGLQPCTTYTIVVTVTQVSDGKVVATTTRTSRTAPNSAPDSITILSLESTSSTTFVVHYNLTDKCDVTSNIFVYVDGKKNGEASPSASSYTVLNLLPCSRHTVTLVPVNPFDMPYAGVANASATNRTQAGGTTGVAGNATLVSVVTSNTWIAVTIAYEDNCGLVANVQGKTNGSASVNQPVTGVRIGDLPEFFGTNRLGYDNYGLSDASEDMLLESLSFDDEILGDSDLMVYESARDSSWVGEGREMYRDLGAALARNQRTITLNFTNLTPCSQHQLDLDLKSTNGTVLDTLCVLATTEDHHPGVTISGHTSKNSEIDLQLTRNDGCGVATEIKIYVDGVLKDTQPASTTAYTVTGLERCNSYEIRVDTLVGANVTHTDTKTISTMGEDATATDVKVVLRFDGYEVEWNLGDPCKIINSISVTCDGQTKTAKPTDSKVLFPSGSKCSAPTPPTSCSVQFVASQSSQTITQAATVPASSGTSSAGHTYEVSGYNTCLYVESAEKSFFEAYTQCENMGAKLFSLPSKNAAELAAVQAVLTANFAQHGAVVPWVQALNLGNKMYQWGAEKIVLSQPPNAAAALPPGAVAVQTGDWVTIPGFPPGIVPINPDVDRCSYLSQPFGYKVSNINCQTHRNVMCYLPTTARISSL